MNIILLGPPGIGKGTQGDIIAARFGIPKISGGDMLREETRKATTLGQEIKTCIDRGELVTDIVVMEIMRQRLRRPDCKNGFILDGFPRTLEQAEALERMITIDLALNLTAPRKELLARMAGRLTCRQCGGIFHVKFNPPKRKGVCDKCGGELYIREDQKESVVIKRLEIYEKETKPLTEYYKKKELLKNVNATGAIEDVSARVQRTIDDFKKGVKVHGK